MKALPNIYKGRINLPLMTNTDTLPMSAKIENSAKIRKSSFSKAVFSVGAAIGIFGGISSLFGGLVCVLIHAMLASEVGFDKAGTFLLIIAIPMMLVGSVLLDRVDKVSRQ